MTMPSPAQQSASVRVAENPEIYAGSLAHILHREQGKTSVVGQAWLAGANKLITCGHVVEPFLNNSASLLVKFPASGAEYSIDSIKLHPSFGRQDDQLLKFDAAVLSVRLRGAELASTALPLRFDQDLKNQETLWTVRYPSHLGALTSAPDPLQQSGHFLGRLRKQDNFHLLHDLPLSPGDSGAALFSNQGVVGIHCGDTASLPGLNLPTTSIRLALWVDALKEIGIQRNVSPTAPVRKRGATYKIVLGVLAAGITFGACFAALAAIYQSQLKESEAGSAGPLTVSFRKVTDKDDRIGSIHIKLKTPCHLYLLFKESPEKTYVLYGRTDHIDTGELDVLLPEDLRGSWQSGAGNLVLVAVKASLSLISSQDLPAVGKTVPLINDSKSFWERVKNEQANGGAICQMLIAPPAGSKLETSTVKKAATQGRADSASEIEGDPSKTKADTSVKPDKTDDKASTGSASDQKVEDQESSGKSP